MDSSDGEPPPQKGRSRSAMSTGNRSSPAPSSRGSQTPLLPQRSSGRVRQKPKGYSPEAPEAERKRSPSPSPVTPAASKAAKAPVAPSPKLPVSKKPSVSRDGSVDTPQARARQRTMKRFSPSPPPSKKVRRSPDPPAPADRQTHTESFSLSELKKSFMVDGIYPLIDFTLDFDGDQRASDDERERDTPPPVSVKKAKTKAKKPPSERSTPLPNLGIVKLPKTKKLVAAAKLAAATPDRASQEPDVSSIANVASTSKSATPVIRATAGREKPKDDVPSEVTSSGRPARKAAAGVRDLMAQIRPKTPPPPRNATTAPSKAPAEEPEDLPSSPVPSAPVVRLSDMGAPPMSPAPSPIQPKARTKAASKISAVSEAVPAAAERPKRASRSISRSSAASAVEESPQSKKSRTANPAADEPSKSSSSTADADSSEEPSIRRSSRQSAPTSKVLDMQRRSTVRPSTTPTVKISFKPKPGSALEILKKTTTFRVNRSPTPEMGSGSSVTPKPTPEKAKQKEAVKEEKKVGDGEEGAEVKEEEPSEPPVVTNASLETVEEATEQDKHPEDELPDSVEKETEEVVKKEEEEETEAEEVALEPPLVIAEETEEDKIVAESVETQPVVEKTPEAADVKLEAADVTTELADSTTKTVEDETLPSEGAGEQEAASVATEPPVEAEQPPPSPEKSKAKGKAVKSTPKAPPPAPMIPSRRSGRSFKPNKLFEDFVGPETIGTSRPAEPELIRLPAKHPKNRRASSPRPVVPPLASPAESAAEKTRKHLKENRPVKVLMKLGSEVSTRVVGAEEPAEGEAMEVEEQPSEASTKHLLDSLEDLDDEEPSSMGEAMSSRSIGASTSVKRKEKSSRFPTWWTNYTPSEKPILEDHIRPDGTVEKIGIKVNAVMDRLLLLVCDDGITRNSNAHSKANKSKQLLELAKQRYFDKKKIDDEKKAEALAQGKEYVEAHATKKTTSELFAHTISTRDRAKKAALYKQNEYIQKPVKLAKEHESEKEKSERKALDYLSKQFNREAEEDLRHGRDDSFYKPRKAPKVAKKVSFADFVTSKAPDAREMLIPTTRAPDTFYRELLRPQNEDVNVAGDMDVDIMAGADEPIPDLSTFEQTAAEASNKIAALLLRPQSADGSFDVSGLYLRIQEEAMERRGLCDFVMNDVVEFFVTQSSSLGEPGRNVLHNEALRHATALQAAFARCTQESSVWTHRFLLENLPVSYLISYLILFRYLRYTAGSSFTNLLLKPTGDDHQPWPQVTEIIARYINSKPLDPDREDLQSTISPNCLSDVLFVMVPPCFAYGDCTVKGRAHDVIYRWLKAIGDKDSFTVELDFSEHNDSVVVAAERMIRCVKEKIQKLVKERRDKRIVLVGWNVTCYFNHRVVQLTHGVSAIIDFAFPLRTAHGWRGTADDDILLTYCPSLFIMGSEADDFNPYALKELRSGMICENGAVVIHDADSDLNVQLMTLNTIGITQRTVYRSILETVIDFLQLDFTKKERSQLIQHDLNCVYDLDVEALKSVVGQPTQRGRPPGGGAKPPAERVVKPRKRKLEAVPPPLQSQPTMPALQPETMALNCTTVEARSRFDDIIKKSFNDMRRPEDYMSTALASFNRPVVKASPLPSPAIAQSSARSGPELLDPANISLN